MCSGDCNVISYFVLKWGSCPDAGHLSRYVTSHPGQLSLSIPSWVGAMSTSQRAVMSCSWGVKAGMVRVWMASKTVWSPCYTQASSEHFRGAARWSAVQIYITLLYFTLLLDMCWLFGSLPAVVLIHTQRIWQAPVCAVLQDKDLDLSGSDVAEIVYDEDEVGPNLTARQ